MKGKLEDASVEAPAFLWNKIEQKLPPVTPWYSKYKYLILLLGLGFTSSSSIFIYKQFFLTHKKSNNIALNKRMLKDENGTTKKSNESTSKTLSEVDNKSNATVVGNSENVSKNTSTNKTQNTASVAAFYTNSSDSNSTTTKNVVANNSNPIAQSAAKRDARLKRLEVKLDESSNTVETTSTFADASSSSKKSIKKKQKKSGYVSNIATVDDDNVIAFNNKDDKSISSKNATKGFDATTNNKNSGNNNASPSMALGTYIPTTDDVTIPIAEPIKNTNEAPLMASLVPVKENITPLSSREALRAMIEKDKLESLDISSQAAGVADLNPNREKILKNLKQFAGYSINKGFHIGAFIAINNVWLNKKQFSADENTTFINPKVQFGKAYGINIGYDYTDRIGIELEWQISEQGQKYNVGLLKDNNKHTKEVNLMYTKFPILFKYKQTFINNYNSKPISVSFLVGPQFAFLIKQNVKLDGVSINNAPQYNKLEFGINGGFDFDLYMMRYMYLTIGARTGFGSSFQKGQPMSFQLGMTTQLNFRYAKKLK